MICFSGDAPCCKSVLNVFAGNERNPWCLAAVTGCFDTGCSGDSRNAGQVLTLLFIEYVRLLLQQSEMGMNIEAILLTLILG